MLARLVVRQRVRCLGERLEQRCSSRPTCWEAPISVLKITGNGWCIEDQAEAGDGPLEGGNSEASMQGQQHARNKGKVRVRDSWCAGWLAKAKARRRQKEEKEEKGPGNRA